MARRSVVLETAPAPPPARRTVVLRAGGPAPAGRVRDVIVGILGVLLLVACIVLASLLPDRDYLNPQFRVTYPIIPVEAPGQIPETAFVEGQTQEFAIEIPDDNIVSVTLVVGFPGDDIPLSLPDQFQVELLDPSGTSKGIVVVENEPPTPPETPGGAPTWQEGVEVRATFQVAPLPSDEILGGLSHTETVEQAQARVEPTKRVPTAGTWTVRVSLNFAGDCPEPGQGYASQSMECQAGNPFAPAATPAPNGEDPGNSFIVADVEYSFYQVVVQEIE